MAAKSTEMRRYSEIKLKRLEQRYLAFGRAVMARFTKEMNAGGEALFYDMVTDADVLQLQNPVSEYSGERWQVTVVRYSPEVLIERLCCSPDGGVWMTGVSFQFDQEVLTGESEISDVRLTNNHPDLLDDDAFFTGICEAIERWNASSDQVSSIEEELEKLDLV